MALGAKLLPPFVRLRHTFSRDAHSREAGGADMLAPVDLCLRGMVTRTAVATQVDVERDRRQLNFL
jgi:hypothetical protein